LPHELHVSDVLHDTIEVVSDVIASSLNAKDVIRSVRECWEASIDTPDPLNLSTFLTDEFLWMITMGRLRNRWPTVDDHPSLDEARGLLQELEGGEDSPIQNIYSTWISVIASRLVGSRLAKTQQGSACICNQTAHPGDIITVLLGHEYPMLLRPISETPRKYRVLGRCYMHGIMDAEALLGSLPMPWEVGLFNPLRSVTRTRWMFRKSSRPGHHRRQDPRLGPLPQDWELIEMKDEMRLSWEVQHYRNRITGEVINSDPRMLPEALEARGVRLETICLI
jgi:hypothetical protein